jgi:uncharacterized delta-60 repeat protein
MTPMNARTHTLFTRGRAAALVLATLIPATPALAEDAFKFTLARYTPAGALDGAFGAGGIVVTDIGASTAEEAKAARLDAAGRIVVAGSAVIGGSRRFAVARYQANGVLDPAFGAGGVVTTDFLASTSESANAIAIDAASRIVVAGYGTVGGSGRFAVARYLPNGALDGTFGVGGIVLSDLPMSANEVAYAVGIDDAAKIVAAGSAALGGRNWFVVARYMPNGALDPAFSGDGIALTDAEPGGAGGVIKALAIDSPSDLIVVVGESGVPAAGGMQMTLARYAPNGALDGTFDGDGKLHTNLAGTVLDRGFAVTVTPDHRIVAAGLTNTNGAARILLARYTWNGALDPSFAGGIVVTNLLATTSEWAAAMQIDVAGRIVVAGGAVTIGGSRLLVARYMPNGVLDGAFGGGIVTTDLPGSAQEQGNALVLDVLGRPIIVGRK